MRSSIEGIAFDLDGTLYPNYRLNIRLIPFILKEWRLLAAFGEARVIIRKEQKNGAPPRGDFYNYQAELTAKLMSKKPDFVKEKIDRLMYKGWEELFKKIKLFKGAAETLDTFKKAGLKLGLLSDFPPEKKLENLGLLNSKEGAVWDAVLCSEHCGAIKPHPQSFTTLASLMGLPCEKILYVGNSHSYDIIGANGAGMKTALIRSPLILGSGCKKPKPDFSFHSYRQLRRFMVN
ncbi:MAG: HAD family hydrolase [Treponema sp.]|nr:HAD family hydrolase [Treponema sp.]